MLDEIAIRVLTPEDAQPYRSLRLLALGEAPHAFSASLERELAMPDERWVERTTPTDDSFTLGALGDDGLVGSVTFYRESAPKLRHRGNLVAMYVHPEHRGRGIGRRLVGALLERASALDGLRLIQLWVAAKNHPAKLLYASHGFRTCGRDPLGIKVGETYRDEEHMVYVIADARPEGDEAADAVGPLRQYGVWQRSGYTACDDPDRLDVHAIHRYLSHESYWAKGRSRESVVHSIANSLVCMGVFDSGGAQVGFARVVSDGLIIAWVCDVFVLEEHRGQGLGKWLVELVTGHPRLVGVKRFVLLTADAHGLYQKYGFAPVDNAGGLWMERMRAGQM